jgi:hypothetical protein
MKGLKIDSVLEAQIIRPHGLSCPFAVNSLAKFANWIQ